MRAQCFPAITPYDPAEDPPSSRDPLGLVSLAEGLADVLFPGMTARMWRPRFLTFAALAAHLGGLDGDAAEDPSLRLELRLGLERLFVAALARHEDRDEGLREATRRVPGIGLARAAWRTGDQPLGNRNFLKGQAINGPFGVIARLARDTEIVDSEDRLGRNGETLLERWSNECELAGIFDSSGKASPGKSWCRRMVGKLKEYARSRRWPDRHWEGWRQLAEKLRADDAGTKERQLLHELLISRSRPIRRRLFELLRHGEVANAYRNEVTRKTGRNQRTRQLLNRQIRRRLSRTEDVDRQIEFAIRLINAFEPIGDALARTMQLAQWALTSRRGGRAAVHDIVHDVADELPGLQAKIKTRVSGLRQMLARLPDHPLVEEQLRKSDDAGWDRFDRLCNDAATACAGGNQELLEAVLARHERVQRDKRKGVWIERDGDRWTILPGHGIVDERPAPAEAGLLFQYRFDNAYWFLVDLKRVSKAGRADDGEA